MMEDSVFIPFNVEDLYNKLVNDKFMGKLSLDKNWLIWELPNGVTLEIAINNPPHEGYIGTYYTHNNCKIILTHWHPMDNEIYTDLKEINRGDYIWIAKIKKPLLSSHPIPMMIKKQEYESFSEKRKRKFYILNECSN